MKIKVEQTTTKEVEIKLPYYSKSPCHFYKVVSENDGVQINVGQNNGISRGEVFVGFAFQYNAKKISELEFNQAYEDMLHRLAR